MQNQGPYKVHRRHYVAPHPPKKCEIVETMTGIRREGTDIFPSRKQAKKALAQIVPTLPRRSTPDEVDQYYIRNI